MIRDDGTFTIAIVTAGAVRFEAGGETHQLETYDKVLLPAGLGPVKLTPVAGAADILECLPPA